MDSTRSFIIPSIEDYEYLAKIIIIGNSSTGKTCLLHKFIKNDFNIISSQTIGVEFSSKIVTIGDTKVKLQLWDTAGQERFRSLTRSYYRGSAGVVICYDVSNPDSLELDAFLQDIKALSMNPSIIIVGNKIDLNNETEGKLMEFMEFYPDLKHLYCSAKNGLNINEIFKLLTMDIINKIESNKIDLNNQNYGVQINDSHNMDTINSSIFNQQNSRILKRKTTTLSLIDRSLDQQNKCNC